MSFHRNLSDAEVWMQNKEQEKYKRRRSRKPTSTKRLPKMTTLGARHTAATRVKGKLGWIARNEKNTSELVDETYAPYNIFAVRT